MGSLFQVDLIEAWPRHLDYPLHRKFIKENRDRFERVIIVFTSMNTQGDYRNFVKHEMRGEDITFTDNDEVHAEDDWRNKAVNRALKYSDAEWVWFTEQDFFPLEGFWEAVEDGMKHYNVFGANVGERLHPCCIFAKRKTIDQTSKNFGVIRDVADHFSIFQREVGPYGYLPPETWYHMNALSQNMFLLQSGEEPNFRPEEFKEYCEKCLKSGVNIHPDFRELFLWYVS